MTFQCLRGRVFRYKFFYFSYKRSKKIPFQVNERGFKIGIDLLLRALGQLPSALSGLTALFGMGKGEPR